MKKKLFAVLIAVVIAAFAGYNNYQSQKMRTGMSDLMLANVEALADFEWNENGWYCWKEGYDDGGDLFFTYIRCSDCSVNSAVSVWDQGQCWHH